MTGSQDMSPANRRTARRKTGGESAVSVFGADHLVIRGGPCSLSVEKRSLSIGVMLLAGTAIVALIALTIGAFPLSVAEIAEAILGLGDEKGRMVVMEWRLPRVLLAVLLGMALGISGAIFQSLTRNPLGSPDVIGFSAGSYTGALIVLLHLGGGHAQTAIGALAGGFGTAAIVYALAWRRGIEGFRMILVGIGVSAMLGALNMWMIRQASLQAALGAAFWGAGSLNGLGWGQVRLALLALALLLPFTLLIARSMRQLELGDEVASATGVRVGGIRLALTLIGVALTATATAVAGPIAFISLVSPQIARRISAAPGVSIVLSALVGGLLLLVADWAVQRVFGNQLPVGVITVMIGGLYFIWLLIREARA